MGIQRNSFLTLFWNFGFELSAGLFKAKALFVWILLRNGFHEEAAAFTSAKWCMDSYSCQTLNKMTYQNPITHNKNYLDISSEQAVVVLDILFTVSVCLSPISRIPIFLKIWGHISWNMRGLKSSIRFNSIKIWYPFNLESSLAASCKYKLIKRPHLYFFSFSSKYE